MKKVTPKKALLTGVGFALVGLFLWLSTSQDSSMPDSAQVQLEEVEEMASSLRTIHDSELVFKKAFWRRPQDDDRIKQAERREWVDTDSRIVKWQWFIELEASEETLAWLETNPFAMARQSMVTAEAIGKDFPDWFPQEFAGHKIYQRSNGFHLIAISPDGKKVFSTDRGGGIDG